MILLSDLTKTVIATFSGQVAEDEDRADDFGGLQVYSAYVDYKANLSLIKYLAVSVRLFYVRIVATSRSSQK